MGKLNPSLVKHKFSTLLLTSLTLGVIFDWLFIGKIPGISVSLYTFLILAATLVLAKSFKIRVNKSLYWLIPFILFFSIMIFVRANLFLAFMNICIITYLLLLTVRLSCQPSKQLMRYELADYAGYIFLLPFRMLSEFFRITLSSFSNSFSVQSRSSYAPIVRGVVLSLPILLLFVLLLSSADLVFKELVSSLFDLNISAETIFRWSLIAFITSVFCGAYALIFMPSSAYNEQVPGSSRFSIGPTESSIILSAVNLLFFTFVVIQLRYLFGGSDLVLSGNYTYAEYARKGFFELIAVAALTLLLVGSIKKYTLVSASTQVRYFKWLSGILISQVAVIILSAHTRLDLYENAYGFTILRLFSHLFILWLAYAFAQLLYNIIKERVGSSFLAHLFLSALCFFAVFNLINPDGFIARQNIRRFNTTGRIDLYYLSNLSEDATPDIAKLLDHPNADIQKGASSALYRQRRSALKPTHWQSANIARQRAYNVYSDKAVQIDKGGLYNGYREIEANKKETR